MLINPIYVIPTIALVIASFIGFDRGVIALLVLGGIGALITFLSQD